MAAPLHVKHFQKFSKVQIYKVSLKNLFIDKVFVFSHMLPRDTHLKPKNKALQRSFTAESYLQTSLF